MTSHLFQVLKWTYGIAVLAAGVDKFFYILTDWNQYLSPMIAEMIPAETFMMIVGVVEIVVGLLILLKWTRLGAYVAMGWLLAISANLITLGYYDIAVRDIVMAVGAYTLARLAELELKKPA